MDSYEIVYQAPVVLRLICYCAGMAVFLAEILWLSRLSLGYGNKLSLRDLVGAWFVRILAACAFLSLLSMLWSNIRDPAQILPEISILFLSAALYLCSVRKPFGWKHVITRQLPLELVITIGVLLLSIAAWAICFAMGWALLQIIQFAGGSSTQAIFLIGLLWNAPLVLLFLHGSEKSRVGALKFHQLLWPVLLAYIFLLLPDIAERIVNSEEVRGMMNAPPPMQRL